MHDLEYHDWLQSITDSELIAKANKIGIYIDDFPAPDMGDECTSDKPYYTIGAYGDELLHHETRRQLISKVRQRMPEFHKERRDIWSFRVNSAVGVIGAVTALLAIAKS